MRLLLLHGAGLGGRAWEGLLPHWPAGWEILAPDLPGHMGVAPPEPATLAGLEDWLAHELRRTEPTAALGWSMGSFLLQWTLARRGALGLRAAVLVNGAPARRLSTTPREVLAKRLDDHFAAPLRPVLPTLRRMAANGWAPDAVAALEAGVPEADEGLLRHVRWEMFGHDFGAAAATFPVPVLLVHGQDDSVNPVSQARWAEGAFPKAALRLVPGRHAPFASDPATFTAAVESGLAELLAAGAA